VTYTVTEEKALVLASGHPFITTLYSCFQIKVVLNFFKIGQCLYRWRWAETSGRTAQPKVHIDNFHPIRILGEGGFGKAILVKKKPSEGSDQRFAIKVLKKSHIISCCSLNQTVTEKKALVLASGHPFITTLYSCFQTRLPTSNLRRRYSCRGRVMKKKREFYRAGTVSSSKRWKHWG